MCVNCAATGLSRRLFLGAGLATLAAPLVATGARAQTPPPAALSPDEALRRLMDGNARYAANTPDQKDFSAGRAARAAAQYPFAAILGCADSRVAPELAFDQSQGDLFVARVAGNLVTPSLLATLEYGIAVLNVPLVMVLGHQGCGAVNATLDVIQHGKKLPGHLPELVAGLRPGVEPALHQKGDDLPTRAVISNVQYNVQRLRAEKPIFSAMVAAGKVKVVGGVYDLATGKITLV